MKEYTFVVFMMGVWACDQERCCDVDTCTYAYCTQKNSETWISDLDYSDYQYTKLTLDTNSCLPCPYDCKVCSSTSTCDTCSQSYYMNDDGECTLCGYKCNACSVVNSISKCSECQDGTYLDSSTLTCKSCPVGAKTCANAFTISECQSGYLKSSNSLYCTACPDNCLSCPISDSYCSVCQTGYYVSSGTCIQCTVNNCDACIGFASVVYCTNCAEGYYVVAGACTACPNNCLECVSGVCTTCDTGYYVNSGSCSSVSTSITNCQTYSSRRLCSSCVDGYYLDTTCFPCSILCSQCDGMHFGTCSACTSVATLYNQMCIVDAFPDQSTYRKYVALPADIASLDGGSVQCTYLYMGTGLSIQLSDLSAYKISMHMLVYGGAASQTYTLTFNNNTLSYTTSTTSFDLCSITLYIGEEEAIQFSDVALNNTLQLESSSNIYLAQIVITAYRCNDLCLECSQSQCFTCLTENLYTQDAYCVYTCSNGYYTYEEEKQCVSSCPATTYAVLSNTSCLPCVSPCLTCSSEQNCLSCVSGYYLTESGTCSTTCPDQYYGSDNTQECEACIGWCYTCISEEECLSCRVGFLEGTQCVDSCTNSSLYEDLDTLECTACDATCATCEYTSTYCLSCVSSLFYLNHTCLATCPSYYYQNSPNCDTCTYPCQNCQNTTSTCSSCWDRYLLGSDCTSACPDGYYEDNEELLCVACDTGCSVCYGGGDNCLSCTGGYYFFDNECRSVCPDQYYGDADDNVCEQCVGLCYTCTNSTYCTGCSSNFLYQGQCVRASDCPTGYFADITTLQCGLCNSSCTTCAITATQCTSCSNGTYLYQAQCVSECTSQYYYPSGNVCEPCQEPCLTCVSESECLSCVDGYKYSASNNVCSSSCSVGTYFNSSINDCSSCSSNCLMCDSEQFCDLCEDSYYLYVTSTTDNQCKSECPDGYYPDNLVCQACLYPCATCTSSIDCLTCANGIQYESRCISGCPQSTYMTNDTCQSCTSPCLTCEDTSTNCLSCVTSYYLEGSNCVSECSVGTYGFTITLSCLPCPDTCSECLNTTHCTVCITNTTYLDSENGCVQYCATGYFGDDSSGECQSCDAKCYTCSGSSDNCLTCASGYLLVKEANAQFDCKTTCPSEYYNDNDICYPCIFPCAECTSSIACTTCATGTYFHSSSSSCLLTCPSGTYYSSSGTAECVSCTSPCVTCTDANNCLSCDDGLNLYEGSCVSECPSQYYADNSGICNRCVGLCLTCSGKYSCLTCHTGYAYDGFCYGVCPPGTYSSSQSQTCEGCSSPCMECSLQSNYCTRCLYNLYAYQGDCSSTCPTGTYASGDLCTSCNFPCVDCNDQFTCNECLGGYLLYINTSCITNVDKCPNDLYKMNSNACVPITWCDSDFYKDIEMKTCSSSCTREKYVYESNKTCVDECGSSYWVAEGMVCTHWSTKPQSLMMMSVISFVQESEVRIFISFNESVNWVEQSEDMYVFTVAQRRLLATSTLSYRQESVNELVLHVEDIPPTGTLSLPAYYLTSSSTNYPLQNPSITVSLPSFTPYSASQRYTGKMMGQFSKGVSWFIILFSLFFLFMNRLSDLYILWDTAQLLYLLVFLNIQYPPNLDEFLLGMYNTHFLFLPSIFVDVIPSGRNVSDPPFYANSYDNNFLRTAGKVLLIVFAVLFIYLLLKIAEAVLKKCECARQRGKNCPKFKKFVFKGILRFRWHHASDLFFITYDIIMLFAVAELTRISENPDNAFSNVMGVLSMIIYIGFPIFVGLKLYKHFPNISRGKMVANLKCFYRGIEKTNKFGIALILIRYLRKILYCVIIGIFSSEPMFALPILMFSSVLMGLFIFVNMPFKKRLSNILTIATQVVLVLVYIMIALNNFYDDGFDPSIKYSIGWICCFLLVLMLFALIFQVFCKTMFYLEPQNLDEKQGQGGEQLTEEYLRKKAGEFFDHIFPKIRESLGWDDSEDNIKVDYEDGDSDNSENNDLRAKKWNIQESQRSDEFKHYGNQSDSDQTEGKPQENNPPQYLIRCMKEFQ